MNRVHPGYGVGYGGLLSTFPEKPRSPHYARALRDALDLELGGEGQVAAALEAVGWPAMGRTDLAQAVENAWPKVIRTPTDGDEDALNEYLGSTTLELAPAAAAERARWVDVFAVRMSARGNRASTSHIAALAGELWLVAGFLDPLDVADDECRMSSPHEH